MPQTSSSFRFVHNVSAIIQQLRLSLGVDTQKAVGDTAALLDDRDRQLEDYLSQLDNRIGTTAGVPSGGMFEWAGGAAPDGYVLCDGSALNRADYPSLFNAIGTIWGAGNGTTTFNVPDFRGRVTIGAGAGTGLTARTVGQTGGTETVALSTAQLPSHTHSTPAHDHSYTAGGANITFANNDGSGYPTGTSGQRTGFEGSGTSGAAGSGSGHPNMQPFAVVTKIIKT